VLFRSLIGGSGDRFGHGVTDCAYPHEECHCQGKMKTAMWGTQT